jgi:hypothetical protein
MCRCLGCARKQPASLMGDIHLQSTKQNTCELGGRKAVQRQSIMEDRSLETFSRLFAVLRSKTRRCLGGWLSLIVRYNPFLSSLNVRFSRHDWRLFALSTESFSQGHALHVWICVAIERLCRELPTKVSDDRKAERLHNASQCYTCVKEFEQTMQELLVLVQKARRRNFINFYIIIYVK